MSRPTIERCAYVITPGTPLEPPEYCGQEADWLTERCEQHTPADTTDTEYECWREDQRL